MKILAFLKEMDLHINVFKYRRFKGFRFSGEYKLKGIILSTTKYFNCTAERKYIWYVWHQGVTGKRNDEMIDICSLEEKGNFYSVEFG